MPKRWRKTRKNDKTKKEIITVHELPHTEIVKFGTIRLASDQSVKITCSWNMFSVKYCIQKCIIFLSNYMNSNLIITLGWIFILIVI